MSKGVAFLMGKKNKNTSNNRRIFPLKIRTRYFVGIFIIILAAVLLVREKFYRQDTFENSELTSKENSNYQIRRAAGYKFIRPLLSAKPLTESGEYAEIKKSVNDFITAEQHSGVLLTASLYLRNFDNADWTAINPDEKYIPGSILKIPMMIAVLENEEANSGFLNRKIPFNMKFYYPKGSKQFIAPERQIEYGKSYTYEELLRYMIEYSDNLAYSLLIYTLNLEVQNRVYEEFGLPMPNYDSLDTRLTVKECSVFMESLINASIVNRKNSEYALNMLTRTRFRDGVVKGMADSTILIAHKFAEGGSISNKELHETAVVYICNQPYLLTIMTRGKDNVEYDELAKVIQGIAKIIHDGLIKMESDKRVSPSNVPVRSLIFGSGAGKLKQ
jgi:beta-lactamase class A